MAEVYSNPRPTGRSAAHRIDQHVISGEKLLNLAREWMHAVIDEEDANLAAGE